MSFGHYRSAWAHEGSSSERLLLLALADHADRETGVCWPSIGRLAAMTGMSRSTIYRLLSKLEAAGAIERHSRAGRSSAYVLPPVSSCEGSQADTGRMVGRGGPSTGRLPVRLSDTGVPKRDPNLVLNRETEETKESNEVPHKKLTLEDLEEM
jgi:DNA-binding transcriptional ArsR family regulator